MCTREGAMRTGAGAMSKAGGAMCMDECRGMALIQCCITPPPPAAPPPLKIHNTCQHDALRPPPQPAQYTQCT